MVLRRGVFTPRSIQTLIQTAMARLEEMGEPEQLAGFTVPTAKSREDIELLRGKEEYSKYAEMLFTCINRAIAAFRQENGEVPVKLAVCRFSGSAFRELWRLPSRTPRPNML